MVVHVAYSLVVLLRVEILMVVVIMDLMENARKSRPNYVSFKGQQNAGYLKTIFWDIDE